MPETHRLAFFPIFDWLTSIVERLFFIGVVGRFASDDCKAICDVGGSSLDVQCAAHVVGVLGWMF